MRSVKDILGEAVREYNNTIFGNRASFHKNDTYTERRGIFYNCLRRGFQQVFDFTKEVSIDKLHVTFHEDWTISSFKIDRIPNWGTPHNTIPILNELTQLSGLEYLATEARIDLDSIKNFKFTF